MSENGQNIRPGFIDDFLAVVNPSDLNEAEKKEGVTMFLHALIVNSHGFKNKDDPEEVPREYLDQLKPETMEKLVEILSEHAHGTMPPESRIGQLGEAVLQYLQSKSQEVEV